MSYDHLKTFIDSAYEHAAAITPETKGVVRDAVEEVLTLLDKGTLRVAEKVGGDWIVHQWLKKAILLSFRLHEPHKIDGAPAGGAWWDKVPNKFAHWKAKDFKEGGFRVVPGAVVRRSAYIAPGVVLMPSFVNLGARVDSGTMVDTWATVGSCAQIGKNVHLSGGAGIGGVLEPLQANPVIIEDNCFIGARAEVAEGVIVGEGSVLSMGVYLGQSTAPRASCIRAACRPTPWSFRAPCRASPCPMARQGRRFIAPSSSRRSTSARAPRPRSTNCSGIDGGRPNRFGLIPRRVHLRDG